MIHSKTNINGTVNYFSIKCSKIATSANSQRLGLRNLNATYNYDNKITIKVNSDQNN